MLEMTSSSTESFDHAVRTAPARAAVTIRHMDFSEVMGTHGEITQGEVANWQATLKAGYRLER
jgi:dodecin